MSALSDRLHRLLDAALGAVPGAQQRPGQVEMAAAVDRALRTREHLLVQAGTGTGKSLAYLVPALASGRRVVVATATKALQAQLVGKDLPRLVAALAGPLGRTPTYALAKGRGNYLCLQQVHGGPGAVAEPEGLFETAGSALGRQVVALREWAGETADRRPRRGAVPGQRPGVAAGVGLGPRLPGRPLPGPRRSASPSRRGRRPPRSTSWWPTTRCSPSTCSAAARCCPSTTPSSSTRRTSSSPRPPRRSPRSWGAATCAGR